MSEEVYIIRPDNSVRYTAMNFINALDKEIEWEVIIKKHKKNKSRSQERYFHKLVDIICSFNGDEKADMKRRIAWNCHLREEFITDDGEVKSIPMSTSGLKVGQYSAIIEAAQLICMELGLRYPDPEEDRGYSR